MRHDWRIYAVNDGHFIGWTSHHESPEAAIHQNLQSEPTSSKGHGHLAVFLAGGPDRDFNVLPEGGQEFHQAPH